MVRMDHQQLTFGGLLDAALKLFTKHFVELAKVAAVFGLVSFAVFSAIDLWGLKEEPLSRVFFSIGAEPIRPIDLASYHTARLLKAVLSAVFVIVAAGALLRAADGARQGNPVGLGDALKFGLRGAHSVTWIWFAYVAGVFFASFALLIGGIFAATALCLGAPVFVVEGAKGLKALRRSHQLVTDNWWRVFGFFLVIGIIGLILGSIVPGLIQVALIDFTRDHFDLGIILAKAAGAIGYVILGSLYAAALIAVYYDLRVRREGYDVERLVEQLEATAPGEGTSGLPSS